MIRPIARQRLFVPVTALARTAVATPRAPAAWRASSSFPIADPSFWKSMIPKPFRRTPSPYVKKKKSKIAAFKAWMAKDWNPATFFIIIFLFIGSMSINMIALKKSFETFTRQSDVRIGLLREVVEKLQRGEKVDVEKVLGTGVPEQESEWEQGKSRVTAFMCCNSGEARANKVAAVLHDLEKEDVARSQKRKQPEPAPSPKMAPALKEEPLKTTQTAQPIEEATSRDFF
jgi:predicted small integral membrane protein